MTSILLVGVEPELRTHLHPHVDGVDVDVQVMTNSQQALAWLEQHRETVLAVVLGPQLDEPVRLAQRIYRLDREIAVLILSPHEYHVQVSRAIQFTPFLGDYVTSHPSTDILAIAEALQEAVQGVHQRRHFRTTIAAMNERLKSSSVHRISAIQYLDHLLDHVPIGVLALDQDGRILSSNRRAGEILGQRERDMLGASWTRLFPGDEWERLKAFIERAVHVDRQSLHEVFERRAAIGDTQFVAVTVAALPVEPDEHGFLVTLQDVTMQVTNEREREAALQLRDEFLSVAAHELKTPLTSIKGYVDLMGRQLALPQWDNRRITRLQEQLRAQVQRLELLVTDLLDASRIQQGRLELRPEPMDLADLARRALQRFAETPAVTPRHALLLDAPEPAVGIWDPDRLDQVITNLVSNALKYSPDGGEVRVVVCIRGDQVELAVNDQGLGIEPELQSRLFQPFMRGVTRGDIPGTGLGLHITSQIIEQHGGTIAVSSAPGQGSTFTVRLPLGAQEPQHLDDQPLPSPVI